MFTEVGSTNKFPSSVYPLNWDATGYLSKQRCIKKWHKLHNIYKIDQEDSINNHKTLMIQYINTVIEGLLYI